MDHLEEISLKELQQALANVGKKPTQRLTAAIAYKNGISQTELAEWYDVQRRTIYSWLKQLEQSRLSTPSAMLTEVDDLANSATTSRRSSKKHYMTPRPRPALVQEYLAETFDVEYSHPSCRRLMKEAGLSYQKPRRTAAEAEAEDRDEFDDELKKSAGRWTPQ